MKLTIAARFKRLFSLDTPSFLHQLFRELLNRDPLPGEAEYYEARLGSGIARNVIAAEIMQTVEGRSLYYQKLELAWQNMVPYRTAKTGLPDPRLVPIDSPFRGPLGGAYRNTKEWMSDYFKDPAAVARHYITFPPETHAYREPKSPNAAQWNHRFHHHLTRNPLAEQFVAVIPYGRVYGANGVVITPDHYLLWDVSPEFAKGVGEHSALQLAQFPPLTFTSETVAVLTSPVSYSYYHWHFEVLARLSLIWRSGISVDRIVLNRQGIRFQDKTLEALGFTKEHIIDCSDSSYLQAEKLVVPSIAAYSGHVPRWACDFLKNHLLHQRNVPKLEQYKRVYVSRADAMFRRILNETEVIRALRPYGFTPVVLASLSATEQMQIFASAEVIVAPHGAGLTNLMYCDPGTKIVEIFTPGFVNPTFWYPSLHSNLDYCYLVSQSSKGLQDGWDGADDMIVDTCELTRLLESEGIRKLPDVTEPDLPVYEMIQNLMLKDDCEWVTRVFWSLLDRDPDRASLEYYVNLVRSGMDKLTLISHMIQHDEARQFYHHG